jgi:23S rRNA-/tRNA-specific pseudouridylate synthase
MKLSKSTTSAPIRLFDQWKKICLNPKCSVLGEFNNQVVALYKPSGILSHPNTDAKALNALIKGPYNQKKECYSTIDTTVPKAAPHLFKTTLIHRLDQQTSGVILVTFDNEKVADLIKNAFRERKVEKEYYALVSGINILQGKTSDTWVDNYDR